MKTALTAIALATLVSTPALAGAKLHRDVYTCVAAYELVGQTRDKVSGDHIVARAYGSGRLDLNRVKATKENVFLPKLAKGDDHLLKFWVDQCRFYSETTLTKGLFDH